MNCKNKCDCANYAPKQPKPEPKVFEAEVTNQWTSGSPKHVNYGWFKIIKKNGGSIALHCTTYYISAGGDGFLEYPKCLGGEYDFATPAERERFERVKAEMEKPAETKAQKDAQPVKPEPKFKVGDNVRCLKCENKCYGIICEKHRAYELDSDYELELREGKWCEAREDQLSPDTRPVPKPPDKCPTCGQEKPKPKFAPDDWVVAINDQLHKPFRYDPSLPEIRPLRHARRLDFAVERNGVKVMMQYDGGGGLHTSRTAVYLNTSRTAVYLNPTTQDDLARVLGCTIIPADFREKE